jgi:eukaryotic-like serine/threonine-protein kinase
MTAQSEAPPTTGLVAEKYQLVRMIGRGGMGSVWEARHASLGTTVAIKFIETEYADSQEARKRFDNEAKAAATIQSKHAIQIYDHGVTPEGKPYIVMELLQGEPLDKRIERMGRLSLQDTARILQQVSRGLARAHERGIVHRDLKPENIFLVRTPDDDEEIAKVLDFGIAKLNTSGPHQPGITSSTKTGAVLGTPFYMSPEQARGLRNVDHRTDVWSLGVIAFKCVTGKLPFDGESVGDLLVKICTAPIPMPSHSIPGLPSSFDAWFMRAMEREPDRRFSSVSELADGLGAAAGMAPRSQVASSHGGHNIGQMATAAVGSVPQGAITPQGLGPPQMMHTPAPQPTPFGSSGSQGGYQQGQQGYGTGGGYQQAGSQTPHPAGMTNSPFTSSQPVQGVGGGKGKWIFGIVGILAVAAGVAFALKFVGMKPKDDNATAGTGLTPPPAASSVATPAPPASDKPAEPLNPQGAGSIVVATPPPSAQPTQKVTSTKVGPTKIAPTQPKTTPTPPTTPTVATNPTTAPTPAPTPVKKPAKNPNDPGY